MDSASTVNMFPDEKLLPNIYSVPKSLTVHCNAGMATTNLVGYFANIPKPIWYNPHGTANILSLHRMRKHFHITYNSLATKGFHMRMQNGDILRFRPSGNGLYHLDLAEYFSATNGRTLVYHRQRTERQVHQTSGGTGHTSKKNSKYYKDARAPAK